MKRIKWFGLLLVMTSSVSGFADSWLGGNPNFGYTPVSIGGSAAVEFGEAMFGTHGPYSSAGIFSTTCCSLVSLGAFTFPNDNNSTVRFPPGICCIGGTLTTPAGAVLPLTANIPGGYLTGTRTFAIFHRRQPLLFRSRSFHHSSRPASLVLIATGFVAIFGSLRRRLKL